MPFSRATSVLYHDIVGFQEFHSLQYNSFDLEGIQRQMDEVIQEMARELMAKNKENFSRVQKIHPYLNLEFDHFIEMLPIHTFLSLPKA